MLSLLIIKLYEKEKTNFISKVIKHKRINLIKENFLLVFDFSDMKDYDQRRKCKK